MLVYALFYYTSVVKTGEITIYEVEGVIGVMIRGLYYIAGYLMDKMIFKKLLQALMVISRTSIFQYALLILMVFQLGISWILVKISSLMLRRKG
ncbi:MAG TPA: hypothetical protein IAC41_11245 [Candidatus Merdenecus merdavium]|nr:hypothetical protein [Candidatus Merdenecus merdavium]